MIPFKIVKTISTCTFLIVAAIIAAIGGMTFLAIRAARNAAMEMACTNNLKQVGLALLIYESSFRRLPMAIETWGNGQLWRSWRSQLYPTFIEQLAPMYDHKTAWDSPTNRRLLNGTPINSRERPSISIFHSHASYGQRRKLPLCEGATNAMKSSSSWKFLSHESTVFANIANLTCRGGSVLVISQSSLAIKSSTP